MTSRTKKQRTTLSNPAATPADGATPVALHAVPASPDVPVGGTLALPSHVIKELESLREGMGTLHRTLGEVDMECARVESQLAQVQTKRQEVRLSVEKQGIAIVNEAKNGARLAGIDLDKKDDRIWEFNPNTLTLTRSK